MSFKLLKECDKVKIRNQWKDLPKPTKRFIDEEIKKNEDKKFKNSDISHFIKTIRDSAWEKQQKQLYSALNTFLRENFDLKDDMYSQKVYVVCQSITQSLRSIAGTEFEKIVLFLFQKQFAGRGVQIKKQVAKGKIDFLLEHKSEKVVVSCKTSTRERLAQDDSIYEDNKYLFTVESKKPKTTNRGNQIQLVTLDEYLENNASFISYEQAFDKIEDNLNLE